MANPNSEAQLGYGSRLEFEMTAGAGDYAELEECGDLPEFGDEIQEVEATNQQSPGKRVEFIGGFKQGQDYTVSCNWFKGTVQQAVRQAAGTTRNFRHIITDGAETPADILTFTFPAVIKSAKVSAPVKEKKQMMVNLRVTGTVTES